MSETGHDNIDAPEGYLEELQPLMRQAMALRDEGKDEEASKVLREILRSEPRLAEPRLELSHIAASACDWPEAENQARMAVDALRSGGQWTLDLEPSQILSFALNLLGEVLVRDLEEGDLLMVDRPRFVTRWNEASNCFREALEQDNANRDARTNCIHYRPMDENQSLESSSLPAPSADDS